MAGGTGKIKPQYDVVIIGAGLSGLTSAALFCRAGMSVAVLEMDAKPGGYLAGFQRGGYKFDSAIHWLNQCGEDGSVFRIFRGHIPGFPKARSQYRIKRLLSGSLDITLTSDPDELKDQLICMFPPEKEGIELFFKDALKIAKAMKSMSDNFKSMQVRSFSDKIVHGFRLGRFCMALMPHVFYSGDEGVEKGLKKYFKDPELRKIWSAENDMLSCLIPVAWAYNGDFQFPPDGGGQVFPKWLESVVNECGGDIFYSSKAVRIIDDGVSATSVAAEMSGREVQLKARYVVASCDVETLYEKIMRPELSKPDFLEKLKNADLYSSAVSVSIGLDCPAQQLGFGEELLLISRDDIARKEHNGGDPHRTDITVLAPSVRDGSMAPEGKGTLTIYAPAYFSHFDNWGTEVDEKGTVVRGDRYRQIKKEFAEILIDRVEKKLGIDIRSHISVMDIATPVTYHRYTGNREGIMMGARPGKNNYKAKIAHYRTPLKNVFLSGHWSNLGGGVPIAVSTAVNTTLMILKNENANEFVKLCRLLDKNCYCQD